MVTTGKRKKKTSASASAAVAAAAAAASCCREFWKYIIKDYDGLIIKDWESENVLFQLTDLTVQFFFFRFFASANRFLKSCTPFWSDILNTKKLEKKSYLIYLLDLKGRRKAAFPKFFTFSVACVTRIAAGGLTSYPLLYQTRLANDHSQAHVMLEYISLFNC